MEKTLTSSVGPSSTVVTLSRREDKKFLLQLARDFHASSIYKNVEFDVVSVLNLLERLIHDENCVVFHTDNGFIAGMLSPLLFNPKIIVASELAWYAPTGGGRELREAFEEWARDNGANIVQCVALANDNMQGLHGNYKNGGYSLVELTYIKEVA